MRILHTKNEIRKIKDRWGNYPERINARKSILFTRPPLKITGVVRDRIYNNCWLPYFIGIVEFSLVFEPTRLKRKEVAANLRLQKLGFGKKPFKMSEPSSIVYEPFIPNIMHNFSICAPVYTSIVNTTDLTEKRLSSKSYDKTLVNTAWADWMGCEFNDHTNWYENKLSKNLSGSSYDHDIGGVYNLFEKWSKMSKTEVLALPLEKTGYRLKLKDFEKLCLVL